MQIGASDASKSKVPIITATRPLVAMQGIVKRFGQTTALGSVDLDVNAGEIHALLGENGAGKSTLMHVLAGLTTLDKGNILLGGQAVQLNTPRQASQHGIAMVHQHFTLVPAFTVQENLALADSKTRDKFVYQTHTASRSALKKAKSLGWELDATTRVADLPVGIQQRVEIVKALATEARILIFDEPTAVLASDEVTELFSVLRLLRDDGNAIILIAHKLSEIMAVADRVTVLHRGRNVSTVPIAATNPSELAEWMVSGARTTTRETSISPAPATPDVDVSAAQSLSQSLPASNVLPPHMPFLADAGRIASNVTVNSFSNSVLTVAGLTVYGDRGERKVSELGFSVGRGEILGIGGVDGNGQTELAEALVGLRLCANGEISWQGKPFLPGSSPTIGYIPQDRRRAGLALALSVEENLLFEAVQHSMYRRGPFLLRRKLRDLAATLLRTYDIRAESLDMPVSSLSGGNQQKIVVARVLSPQPDLIVAVNPARGLDIGATQFVHRQLRKARERGAVTILISTDLDEIAVLADRQAILSAGRLTEYAASAQDSARIGLLLGGLGQRA